MASERPRRQSQAPKRYIDHEAQAASTSPAGKRGRGRPRKPLPPAPPSDESTSESDGDGDEGDNEEEEEKPKRKKRKAQVQEDEEDDENEEEDGHGKLTPEARLTHAFKNVYASACIHIETVEEGPKGKKPKSVSTKFVMAAREEVLRDTDDNDSPSIKLGSFPLDRIPKAMFDVLSIDDGSKANTPLLKRLVESPDDLETHQRLTLWGYAPGQRDVGKGAAFRINSNSTLTRFIDLAYKAELSAKTVVLELRNLNKRQWNAERKAEKVRKNVIRQGEGGGRESDEEEEEHDDATLERLKISETIIALERRWPPNRHRYHCAHSILPHANNSDLFLPLTMDVVTTWATAIVREEEPGVDLDHPPATTYPNLFGIPRYENLRGPKPGGVLAAGGYQPVPGRTPPSSPLNLNLFHIDPYRLWFAFLLHANLLHSFKKRYIKAVAFALGFDHVVWSPTLFRDQDIYSLAWWRSLRIWDEEVPVSILAGIRKALKGWTEFRADLKQRLEDLAPDELKTYGGYALRDGEWGVIQLQNTDEEDGAGEEEDGAGEEELGGEEPAPLVDGLVALGAVGAQAPQ